MITKRFPMNAARTAHAESLQPRLTNENVCRWGAEMSGRSAAWARSRSSSQELVMLEFKMLNYVDKAVAIVNGSLHVKSLQTVKVGSGQWGEVLLDSLVDAAEKAHHVKIAQQFVALCLAERRGGARTVVDGVSGLPSLSLRDDDCTLRRGWRGWSSRWR